MKATGRKEGGRLGRHFNPLPAWNGRGKKIRKVYVNRGFVNICLRFLRLAPCPLCLSNQPSRAEVGQLEGKEIGADGRSNDGRTDGS